MRDVNAHWKLVAVCTPELNRPPFGDTSSVTDLQDAKNRVQGTEYLINKQYTSNTCNVSENHNLYLPQ